MNGQAKNSKDGIISFTIEGRSVTVYPGVSPDQPVIYLNTFAQEAENVRQALRKAHCPDFTLVAVSNLDWGRDMAPWECPSVVPGGEPCTGGADEYLRLLTQEIVPRAESEISALPLWRGIAGYSLGGLFALYSLYRTDLFSRAASMSGSLWFPGLTEFISSHPMKLQPERLYFSLGDRECRTRNPWLQTVEQRTREIEAFYHGQNIKTKLQLHPGGHSKNAAGRTAAGILWLLEALPAPVEKAIGDDRQQISHQLICQRT